MATCRCQNCQNTVGNETREKLVQKLKKKGEEKESLALAAFAISSGSAGGSAVDYVEIPAVTSIGGVDANTVAMVSAGVAASGVDVFLPASSYARQMRDENGKVVNEIAFGIVGRQNVGGKEGQFIQTLLNTKWGRIVGSRPSPMKLNHYAKFIHFHSTI